MTFVGFSLRAQTKLNVFLCRKESDGRIPRCHDERGPRTHKLHDVPHNVWWEVKRHRSGRCNQECFCLLWWRSNRYVGDSQLLWGVVFTCCLFGFLISRLTFAPLSMKYSTVMLDGIICHVWELDLVISESENCQAALAARWGLVVTFFWGALKKSALIRQRACSSKYKIRCMCSKKIRNSNQ